MYSTRRSLFATAVGAIYSIALQACNAVTTPLAAVARQVVTICAFMGAFVVSSIPRPPAAQILMHIARERERRRAAKAHAVTTKRARPTISPASWRMCSST
jgi:hypothetical protein